MINLAVFVSGSGTNCEKVIEHFKGSEKYRVALVLSNRDDAYAIVRAEKHGIPVEVVRKPAFNDPDVLLPLMERYSVDFIVLAGFLLVVPAFLIEKYEGRMINIHPALLPKFGGMGMYGHHVHEAVKAAGETETGMTVHWVSGKVDGGRIIARFRTPICLTDTPDEIAGKEHLLEMAWFADVVEQTLDSVYG